jgi:hypothetical protein
MSNLSIAEQVRDAVEAENLIQFNPSDLNIQALPSVSLEDRDRLPRCCPFSRYRNPDNGAGVSVSGREWPSGDFGFPETMGIPMVSRSAFCGALASTTLARRLQAHGLESGAVWLTKVAIARPCGGLRRR